VGATEVFVKLSKRTWGRWWYVWSFWNFYTRDGIVVCELDGLLLKRRFNLMDDGVINLR